MAKDLSTPPRKKGFSILSLFLGILFGIIITIGAIVGCGALLVYTDLKTVFNVIGFENEDENGNQYINTDKDNGGVSNVLDLISKLTGWIGNIGNMTLEEIEGVLPMTNSIVSNLYDTFGDFVDREKDVLLEDIKTTTFGNIGTLLQGLVDDIVPAALLTTVDLGEITSNALMSTIMYGPQADYIENTSTPVWYNEYNKVGEQYILNGDSEMVESSALSADLVDYLVQQGNEESTLFRLHYFVSGDKYLVAKYDKTSNTFTTTELNFPHVKEAYDKCTGYFYVNENDETITLQKVTISTLSGANGGEGMTSLLNNVELLDMLGGEQEKLIVDILGGITVGNILAGNLEIQEKIDNLELTALDLGVTVDSQIMMYIVFGVTNVTAVPSTEPTDPADPEAGVAPTADDTMPDCQFTASYEKTTVSESGEETGTETVTVYIDSADGVHVDRVYEYIDGEKVDIKATTVNTIGTRIDGITIPAIVDIDINEPIMAYLGYSIYGITPNTDTTKSYTHTAKYDIVATTDNTDGETGGEGEGTGGEGEGGGTDEGGEETTPTPTPTETTTVTAYVEANANGKIMRVYYLDGEKEIAIGGTTTDAIGNIVSGVTDALTLADILDIGVDEKMMAYIAYKITNIVQAVAAEGETLGYTHTATLELDNGDLVTAYIITDETAKITSVYYLDDATQEQVFVTGTTINGVGSAVQNIAIPAIVDIDPEEPIMVYLGYSIYSVREAEVTEGTELDYTHTGKYDVINDDGTTTTVTAYIQTKKTVTPAAEPEGEEIVEMIITGAYYYEDVVSEGEGGETTTQQKVNIKGTTTDQISNVISNITNKLALADFMDIDMPTPDNKNAIMLYMAYGVRSIVVTTTTSEDADGNVTTTTTVTGEHVTLPDEDGNVVAAPVEIIADKDGLVDCVRALANENDIPVGTIFDGTTVSGVSQRVTTVSDNLTLGDFMDIDMPTADNKNAIMMYIAYGVRSIVVTTTTNTDADGTETTTTTVTGEYVDYDNLDTDGNPTYVPVTITGVTTDEGTFVTQVIESDPISGTTARLFGGTTVNGVSQRVSTVSDNLALADFMNVAMPTAENKNVIMMYIAYGVRSITVVTTGEGDSAVTTVTGLYDPYPITDESGVVTETPAPVAVEIFGVSGNVSEIRELNEDGSYGSIIAGTTINDINKRISGVTANLTIGELMTIDENNTIMWSLRNSTVDTLADDIAKLSIQEIYASSIYGRETPYTVLASGAAGTSEETDIDFDADYIYYIKVDDEYVLVNSEDGTIGERGKLTELPNDGVTYYTYGAPQGVWKFMLYETTTTGDDGAETIESSTEKLYSVNDMGAIVNNATKNIQLATLAELVEAGIISLTPEQLNAVLAIPTTDTSEPIKYSAQLRTYTIQGLLDFILQFVAPSSDSGS